MDGELTWANAVKIYMACLENENARTEDKEAARDEIRRLANIVDEVIENGKAEEKPLSDVE